MEESGKDEVNFRPKVVNAVLKKNKTAPPPTPPKRKSSLGTMKLDSFVAPAHAG